MNRFTEGLAIELRSEIVAGDRAGTVPGLHADGVSRHHAAWIARAIPASLWMTADFVVEESLRGFDRRASCS